MYLLILDGWNIYFQLNKIRLIDLNNTPVLQYVTGIIRKSKLE